jgi:hypothetical protein
MSPDTPPEDHEFLFETNDLRMEIEDNGKWKINHKSVDTLWESRKDRFGSLVLYDDESENAQNYTINNFDSINVDNNIITLVYKPMANVIITFNIRPLDDDTVHFSYTSDILDTKWSIESINLLDEAFSIDGRDSYAIIPARLGALIPANTQSFIFDTRKYGKGTYVDARYYNMALLGLVKGSSGISITWEGIDVSIRLKGTGSNIVSSTILHGNAGDIYVHFIANGDYVDIAKYYRKIVMERGLFVTLKEKIMNYPNTGKLIGALSFKPALKFGLSPQASSVIEKNLQTWGVEISKGESIVYWTSDELAKIAEHFKRDLEIEHASFIVYGWMKGGQNMYNPDWFPIDSDIGGNEGLAEASSRIQSLNYSFALFTNFEIVYKSSQLISLSDILVDSNGEYVEENVWPGGPSYKVSPARQIKYAQKNLPLIKDIISPNAAFFDMATVVPLYEDFSSEHPLTQEQTIEEYRKLAEYVKKMVNGPLGGEDAYEWNVPFFDRYEGIAVFKSKGPLILIPFFELVFRETGVIGSHGVSGLSVTPTLPNLAIKEDVLDYISIGRTPRVHFPAHVYYETEGVYATEDVYARADNGWAEDHCTTDRLIKNVYEITSPLNELTIHEEMTDHEFLIPNSIQVIKTIFGRETTVVVNKGESKYEWEGFELPARGFIIDSPKFVAFRLQKYNDIEYSDPPLYTIRSLDDKKIENSETVRVYHGFGDDTIAIKNNHLHAKINEQIVEKTGDHFIFNIETEAVISFFDS